MKRILGVLLAGVLLLSGCGQWQKSQKESAYHLYCLDETLPRQTVHPQDFRYPRTKPAQHWCRSRMNQKKERIRN